MLKLKLTTLGLMLLLLIACATTETETSVESDVDVAETDHADDHGDDEEHDDEEHDDEEHDDEEHDDEEHDDEEHDDEEHDDEHEDEHEDEHGHSEDGDLMLPEMAAVSLEDGRLLKVVATTSIVGDVVSNVSGDNADLTVLMGVGEDPHGYQATPQDVAAMEDADVIFVNGWDLEESVAATIEENFADKMVAISAGIEPLEFGGHSDEGHDEHGEEEHHEDEDEAHHEDEDDHADEEEHEDEAHHEDEDDHADEEEHEDEHNHSGADPHVWFAVHNVETWAENAAEVMGELDPANADSYLANAESYIEQLETLEEEIAEMMDGLPAENRRLVTNHDALGYLAAEYDFEVVGTVLPSLSTVAEPSASGLVELIEVMEEAGVCTIFGETTASNELAETVTAELDGCDNVQVLTIYTGALGEGDTSTYIGMLRSTVQTIVDGLQ